MSLAEIVDEIIAEHNARLTRMGKSMKAKRTVLQVPKPDPSRGTNGRFQQTPGDKLLEQHRKEQCQRPAKP